MNGLYLIKNTEFFYVQEDKTMTRKFIAIFAAILLTASLCACNDQPEKESDTGSKINIGTENTSDGSASETESVTEESDEITTEAVEITFTEQKDTVYVIHSSNQVHLRSEPSMADGTAKGVVTNGTELSRIAISSDGAWSKVLYDGNEYYIGTSCVTTMKDLDAGFTATSKTLTLAGSLYVRIAPSMDNEAIDTLYKGDVVTVVAENTETGWYKVTFDGTYASEGYIVSDAKYFEAETDAE